MTVVYKYKSGTHLHVDAQVAGEVCEQVSKSGDLTPQALVDVSRPEDAPLHNEFEWNDAKAAESYRCEQARYIIRSIEVVPASTERPIRAFVSLPTVVDDKNEDADGDKPKQAFHHIDVVMRRKDSREAVLAQAFKELAAFRRKYVGFVELADVFAAIEQLVAA